MGANSKIQWTTHTFNAWRGCTKVSEGCKHCYAETLSARNPKVLGMWGPQGTRVMASESMWREPVKWNEAAKAAGERHRVFCASLADVFEGPETCSAEAYQVIRTARERLFNLIMSTPHLDWLLLTKRPQNIIPALREIPVLKRDNLWDDLWVGYGGVGWRKHFPNVWLGTSVENQKAADERIPELLKVPAAVRFLSCEPLLGPVDLSPWIPSGAKLPIQNYPDGFDSWHQQKKDRWFEDMAQCVYMARCEIGLHWVIAGGESGPHARPMHPDWPRSLRDQCVAAGVAFFFKQWGEWFPSVEAKAQGWDAATLGRSKRSDIGFPEGKFPADSVVTYYRVGKIAAGRLLDGRTWDEVPGQEAQDAPR